MGRKNKRKPTKIIPLPPVVVKAANDPNEPTPEQASHAIYVRDEIMHIETFTRAIVHRVRQASSLRLMLEKDELTDAQYFAALQVASVAEKIERAVAVRCASLEARVDNSNSSRDVLVEQLGAVRLERAYSQWRLRLPMPRRMVIDMVIADRALFATARRHRVSWPRAKRMLADALDMWLEIMARTARDVDQDELDKAHARACA